LHFLIHRRRPPKPFGRQVFAHLFAHEHRIRADVNDPALIEHALHQRFDLRINQRLAAADRHHRRVAFPGCLQAILQRHQVLDGSRVLADPPAARTSQVAGMQRFELEYRRELLGPANLMLDYVPCDFRRKCQWKSHIYLVVKPARYYQ